MLYTTFGREHLDSYELSTTLNIFNILVLLIVRVAALTQVLVLFLF